MRQRLHCVRRRGKAHSAVTQIGLDTGADSRTGTPIDIVLPSGNGQLTLAVMTRVGRERDDNVPQRPAHEFFGDIRIRLPFASGSGPR